jgi:signal peptidase I
VGQAYAGAFTRAVVWGAFATFSLGLVLPLAYTGRAFVLSAAVVYLGTRLVCAIDSSRVAARATERARYPIVVVALVLYVLAAVVSGLLHRRFVVEAFKIPAASMMPTLRVGDHLFVDKISAWQRGNVVVFPFPEHPNQDFIKRVLAVGGDRIEFDHSHPILNGTPIPSCKVGSFYYDDPDGAVRHQGDLFVESLDGHAYFAFYDRRAEPFPERQGPWTVKPGEVFVIGDNRNNSHDSRMWYGGEGGGVPKGTIKGVAAVVWMSVNDQGEDWNRMGMLVDDLSLPPAFASLAGEVARCRAELRGK